MNIWCRNIVLFGTHKSWIIHSAFTPQLFYLQRWRWVQKEARRKRFVWLVLQVLLLGWLVRLNHLCFDSLSQWKEDSVNMLERHREWSAHSNVFKTLQCILGLHTLFHGPLFNLCFCHQCFCDAYSIWEVSAKTTSTLYSRLKYQSQSDDFIG